MKKRICRDCGDLFIAVSSTDFCPACQRAELFARMTRDMKAQIISFERRKARANRKLMKSTNVVIRRRGGIETRIAI